MKEKYRTKRIVNIRSIILKYLLATTIGLAALLLRLALVPLSGSEAPFITLFPAVALIAMLAGFWPAVLIGIVGTVWIEYYIIPPFGIELDIPTAVRITVMILTSGLVGAIGRKMRLSEEHYRLEQTFLRDVIDATPSLVFVKNWDGRYVLVNKAMAICYGTTIDGIVGKTDADFTAKPEEVVRFLADDREVMSTQKPKFIPEEPVTCADGKQRWCSTYKVPLLNEDGKCDKVLGVATDITERKQAVDALRENEKRLRNQTKELETIISIVSHDLRSPLLNVRGFNKFLKNDCENMQKLLSQVSVPPDTRKHLDEILTNSMPEATGFIDASAGAMNNLVESLVKVARAGLVMPAPETLDMNQLVKNVVDSISIKIKDTGTNIHVENLPPCFADKMHVTQIFTNLIDNAIKYLDPQRKGEICIEGKAEKDHALYWVADNGIGIAQEHQEKIFDIYYRIAEKTTVGGEGIGLSVVKRMVNRNNGRIWLVSEKDRGSNFFIALPLPTTTLEGVTNP